MLAIAPAGKQGRASVQLVSLYAWATRLMPKNGHYNDETYIKIWDQPRPAPVVRHGRMCSIGMHSRSCHACPQFHILE